LQSSSPTVALPPLTWESFGLGCSVIVVVNRGEPSLARHNQLVSRPQRRVYGYLFTGPCCSIALIAHAALLLHRRAQALYRALVLSACLRPLI
jgi:hypothetical protein